jgi:hypothetical protein
MASSSSISSVYLQVKVVPVKSYDHGERKKRTLTTYMLLILINVWKVIRRLNAIYYDHQIKKAAPEALTVINTCGNMDRFFIYLFSRNVLAFDTFFPIADAFQEK